MATIKDVAKRAGISKAGLSVPKELSIVGYDDIFISHYMTPPLTSLYLNPFATTTNKYLLHFTH